MTSSEWLRRDVLKSYKNRTPLEAVKQCMDYMKKVGKAKAWERTLAVWRMAE